MLQLGTTPKSVILQRLIITFQVSTTGRGPRNNHQGALRQGTDNCHCLKGNGEGGQHYREPGRLPKEGAPKPRSDLQDRWPVPVGGERKLPACGQRGRAGLTRDPDPRGVVRKLRKGPKSGRASLTRSAGQSTSS